MSGKILIIEDDPSIRENIVEMLSEEGYQCVTAENGRLGVEAALRERPRAVLCDVSMPELDGHGVLRALRQDEATAAVPFLFLSARADKADIRAGMNLGADDYLTKPFTRRELLDALDARFAREGRAAPRPSNPDSGDQLEKYELRRLIGKGAMGEVWEATHATLGRSVAIKFIDTSFSTDPDAVQRFHLEARAAARLECRNVVAVFDHGVTREGRPFLVMERLQGESLEARLARVGHLPLADVLSITRGVARGLSLAHAAGILHRDLKPENIFLHRGLGDDEEVAKIIDFGVAKFRDSSAEAPLSTRLVGTPLYMSPEQSRGMPIDARSDLWALAVVVFRMAAGELPFSSPSFPTLALRIWNDPAPAPSSLLPGLPQALDAWATRALAKRPEDRFQNASELVIALADALGFAPSPDPRVSLNPLAATLPVDPAPPTPSSKIDPMGETRSSSPGKDAPAEGQPPVNETQPTSPSRLAASPAASAPTDPDVPPTDRTPALPVHQDRRGLFVALAVLTLLVAGVALAMR